MGLADADGANDCKDEECAKEADDDDDDKKEDGYSAATDDRLMELEEELKEDVEKLKERLGEKADDRGLDKSEYSEGDDDDDEKVMDVDEPLVVPQMAKAAVKLDKCNCPVVLEEHCCGKGDKSWTDYSSMCDAQCDGKEETNCLPGRCEANGKNAAAMVGHRSNYLTGGLEATAAHSSQWNIMIVIIQLCILAVCCMSLGLSISFCFKNPNQLMGAGKKSYGREDHMV